MSQRAVRELLFIMYFRKESDPNGDQSQTVKKEPSDTLNKIKKGVKQWE